MMRRGSTCLTFVLDVDRRPVCAGPVKLRALVREPASSERFFRQPFNPARRRLRQYRYIKRMRPLYM